MLQIFNILTGTAKLIFFILFSD